MPVLKYRDPSDGQFKDLVAAGGGSNEVTIAGTTPADPANELWVDTTESTPVYDWSIADNRYLISGFRNVIRNGDMQIAQRGNGPYNTAGAPGIDGWTAYGQGAAGCSITRVQPVLTEGFLLRLITVNQSAASDRFQVSARIEDVLTLAGKTVTLSFRAKAASGTPKIGVSYGQQFGLGGSANVDTHVATATLSTALTHYSMTFTLPSIAGKTVGAGSLMYVIFWVSSGFDTASYSGGIGIQNNTFDITDVQLEAGSVPTPFERLPVQQQLAWCQRYFYRFGSVNPHWVGSTGSRLALGMAVATTQMNGIIYHPVYMRTAPSANVGGTTGFTVMQSTGSTVPCISAAVDGTSSATTSVLANTSSGLVAGNGSEIMCPSTATGYIDVSAEL